MKTFKNLKTLSLTMVISLVLPLVFSHKVFAATYTVVSGDSLYKISKLFNTTTTNIINDNNLSSTNISPGKVLYVSCKTYIVQAGDSLYLIAKKYGIDLYTIRRANNIWNDNITPGQVLDIPIQYISPNPTESKTIIYSSSDVDLLARLITSEAQGEPYSAMVAVGAVVINRVQSGSFANSINGVIYEKINGYYQFTPVLNGWINKPATSEAIKAANAALAGSDPTNGALFYFDNSTTNSWLWSKQISIIIDKLIFSY